MGATIDRFEDPLYTPGEVAGFLGVPPETVRRWTVPTTIGRGDRPPTRSEPVVTAFPASRGHARIPFIGLAEAYVLRAIRAAGVPMQRIRPALNQLDTEMGLAHALGSQRLFTDGAEVLYDYARSSDDDVVAQATSELVVVRSGQRVFADVVADYLRRIEFADGYAQVVPLPAYPASSIIADPRRGFGQPVFSRSGVRLADVLALFEAGEPLAVVADEFGLTETEIEQTLRVALRKVA